MADFTGTYKPASQEHVEDLFKALGLPETIVAEFADKSRHLEFKQTGDHYVIKHAGKTPFESKFKLGEEYTDKLFGLEVKSVAKREGNKLIFKAKGPNHEVHITRELNGHELINTFVLGNTKAVIKYHKEH